MACGGLRDSTSSARASNQERLREKGRGRVPEGKEGGKEGTGGPPSGHPAMKRLT